MTLSYWRERTAVFLATAGLVFVLVTPGWAEDKKKEEAMIVADGKKVSLEFTLSLEDKTTVQSNVGKEPLIYTQGAHEIIPGLEKQLAGLKVGDTKRIELSPEEGYGAIKPELKATREVEKDKIPADAQKVGAKLTGRSPDGRPIFAEVTEVKDKTVMLTIDENHPLAGKKLVFDIKVLKVENTSEKKVDMPAEEPEKPATKPRK